MQNKILFIICFFVILISPLKIIAASEALSGRILLQVENHGEAWYLSPITQKRYYLGRPDDAFRIMREQGIGISNDDLAKIPTESSRLPLNFDFAKKHKGKIFLAVYDKGQAWYVNPLDLKRYYLGRPMDAHNLLRRFGLGISNNNLNKIPIFSEKLDTLDYFSLEKRINELINQERANVGLNILDYSNGLADVAREHSQNLAKENKAFTSLDRVCDLPIIHHEGLNFGLTHSERLKNRNIYNYSRSGENIALIASLDYNIEYIPGSAIEKEIGDCEALRQNTEASFKEKIDNTEDGEKKLEIIRNEIAERTRIFKETSKIKPVDIKKFSEEDIARKTVSSWMESPGHKKNILTPEYNMSGIGVAFIDAYIIATQIFVKTVDCGYLNGPCCESGGCYLPASCESDNLCQ